MVVSHRCDFTAGSIIDDRYQVVKNLGEGSFGMVYAVRDFNGNIVALKL